MWGYLSEFWNEVSGVVIDAWDYTADWFYQVGNAVAGAVGGLFDWLLHYINDLFIFATWLVGGLKTMFSILMLPLNAIFTFIRAFWLNAIKDPIAIDPNLDISGLPFLQIVSAIPYWDTLTAVLGLCLILVGGGATLLILLKV